MFVYIRSTAFVIVVTQKLVFQRSKNVTVKCTETLSPPPSIQYLLGNTKQTSRRVKGERGGGVLRLKYKHQEG